MIETTRDRLATVSKRVAILEEDANKKLQQASTLRSLCNKLYVQILMEEKLLAGLWVVRSTEHVLELEATRDWDDFSKIRELLKPRHNHESYALWGHLDYLRFDDEVVTLRLEHENAHQFIRDHGITVGLDGLIQARDSAADAFLKADALLEDMKWLTA